MRALNNAERFVRLMERDGSRPIPLDEVEGLREAIVAVRWSKHEAADREAAQVLLVRLALLKHGALRRQAEGEAADPAP